MPTKRAVVVALQAAALDERGWPSFAEDPNGAVKRAARSIAHLAIDHQVVVAHSLPEHTTSWLDEHLDAAGRGASLVLRAIGDAHDCPYAAGSELALVLDAEMLVLVVPGPVVRDDDTARAIRSASPSNLVAFTTDPDLQPALRAATRSVPRRASSRRRGGAPRSAPSTISSRSSPVRGARSSATMAHRPSSTAPRRPPPDHCELTTSS